MPLKRWKARLALVLGALTVLNAGCKSTPPNEPPYSPTEGAVGFDVVLESGSATIQGPTKWLATYKSGGHVAQFRIEFETAKDSSSFSVGKGRFVAVPNSDNAALMAELQEAMEAKTLPKKPKRADSLPFEYAILGNDLYRTPTGLIADKKGNWAAIKIFLGGGEGEVFLNLNPALRKGEFSIKDPDYGDFIVGELARVL